MQGLKIGKSEVLTLLICGEGCFWKTMYRGMSKILSGMSTLFSTPEMDLIFVFIKFKGSKIFILAIVSQED